MGNIFDKVKNYYDAELWDQTKVTDAIIHGWITVAEAAEIVGAEDALEMVRDAKVAEMSKACADVITTGVEVDDKHYSMQIEDQLNMMSLLASVQSGAVAVPYHADGEECRFYSAAEFLEIANAATKFKIFQESYFNSLRSYINSMETIEELNSVVYGVEIPEEYQTDVLKELLSEVA